MTKDARPVAASSVENTDPNIADSRLSPEARSCLDTDVDGLLGGPKRERRAAGQLHGEGLRHVEHVTRRHGFDRPAPTAPPRFP